MSIKIASMNFDDCDTILHNTPNGMKNIAEVLGPNGEVYWSAIKELTAIPPLSIRSNGTMLLDYLISGNMSQPGTPTPTAPIPPSETGDRTGNLLNPSDVLYDTQFDTTSNPPAFVYSDTLNCSNYISVATGTYLRMFKNVAVGNWFYEFDANKNYLRTKIPGEGTPMEISSDTSYIVFNISKTIDITKYMFSRTSTALPYEPYGYKIPISSGGENLFASVWEQGSINVTTGQNEVAGTLVRTRDYIPIKPNIPYSFSRNIANGYMNLRLYRADKSYIGSGSGSTIRLISGGSVGNPMRINTFFCCFEVIDSEASYIRFNDSSNNTAIKWLMVEGEYTQQTIPDYEPYNRTTTPIYLGEVPTTRRIKKLVLTGEENWRKSSAYAGSFYADIITRPISEKYSAYCSHLTFTILSSYTKGKFCFNGDVTYKDCNLWFNQFDSSTTVDDFKDYLAQQYANGTPVTVWYVLATPETAVVNEPLRKIGDYADTVSYEQAGVQIPNNRGNTVIDVETTLKPSQMYIKYK